VAELPELGREMHSRAIVLRGRMPVTRWRRFLVKCAEAMGMTPAGKPAIWKYPTEGGKGGSGHTICLPITDSFLVIDEWPDFDGAYLFINSCRRFTPSQLRETIALFGLEEQDFSPPLTLRIE
jgi:hypothetical protein